MARYVIKRILWMIPIILGILLIVFTISYFTPGDPVISMLGSNYTEEQYIAKSIELGLDKPFFTRFVNYVVGVVTRLDLGESYTTGLSVSSEIAGRVGVTVQLGVYTLIFSTIFGLVFGILSAIKQRTAIDNTITSMSMLFASVPNFWLGLMLMLIFSLRLNLLPATGIYSWKCWILPVLTQCLGFIALITRMTRTSVLETIRQDYVRTARSKGLKESAVIRQHVLKNSLIPIITIVGLQIGGIMGGSVIVESIFTIPGLGSYMMRGITSRDYPVINGCVLIMSACICVMNLVTDLAYGFVDPRIKAQYTTVSSAKKLKKMLEADEGKEAA